ncbi:hypothetical protein SAY86_028204 [Trapa natans]|uniref:Uncharacterized protein n=1 Tax=Trapa natans TaxID=22666 RepID=A0AAN7MH64_TRANT|nr:hypothetical protein SAY86_028204 [Trapa natans]
MASNPLLPSQLLPLAISFISLLISSTAFKYDPARPYVVYMGSSSSEVRDNAEAAELSHLRMLNSLSSSRQGNQLKTSLIHHYYHTFRGFSTMLTQDEASLLSGHDNVVSVFPDPILHLHTTRSWDFLGMGFSDRTRSGYLLNPSNDVIIGIIDTGKSIQIITSHVILFSPAGRIWPESPSLSDEGVGEIPSRWKGICMEGPDFSKSVCNRKLIGARYYITEPTSNGNTTHSTRLGDSPRDSVGHGTHTASIAGGAPVANASYYGLARGTTRGGSPSTRISSYKACTEDGCSGAFHAEQMGVLVVCSGGNDGPDPYTIVNSAPWIFTVAASTIDREFRSTVILGNGREFEGSAISFSNLTSSETYPLVFGEKAAGNFTPAYEARNCYPGSLDTRKVSGKIVVCIDTDPTLSRRMKKFVVEDAEAKGIILIDENQKGIPFDSGVFPFAQADHVVGLEILKYMNSIKSPTATILPTSEISNFRPAPVVAYFSSRGPGGLTENILKPDVMAPGVAILAAVVPNTEPGNVPYGKKPSGYSIKSGTSMACPHVAGAAAILMSVHSGWTSSMVKSALMTTATLDNNMGNLLTNSSELFANPHEMGSGEISPYKALHPGLVFETGTEDYLNFLCYQGYSEKNIRSMSRMSFNCPKDPVDELISSINYPSISISKLDKNGPIKIVKRTVRNVGSRNSIYTASIQSPTGLGVKVNPDRIVFGWSTKRVSYTVYFYGKEAPSGYSFGYLTWSDGRHHVRTVFSVNVV